MREKIDEVKGKNRFITAGYVCEYCDSDFGVNEFGMNIKDGIYSMCCPVCKSPVLRVYQWVTRSDELFPAPTMSKEVLDLILKEDEAKIWKDWRIPADGRHGIDNSLFDKEDEECCCSGLYTSCGDCKGTVEEQAGCGDCEDDDNLCDGKESCCGNCDTYAKFPENFDEVMDKIRGRQKLSELDAQVEKERKTRKVIFDRIVCDNIHTKKIKEQLREQFPLRGDYPTTADNVEIVDALKASLKELLQTPFPESKPISRE